MPGLVIELPARPDQTQFNLRRWEELLDDPELARIEGRIETDRHGHIVMSPPPGANHGTYQATVVFHLRQLLSDGRVITECPISTADGVKAADVAWASKKVVRSLGNRQVYVDPPEICVEILSPRNSKGEIEEKRRLYFKAGAKEVWICSMKGEMSFYLNEAEKPSAKSKMCPNFPKKVEMD